MIEKNREGLKMFEAIKKFFNAGTDQQITVEESKKEMPDLDSVTSHFLMLMENTSYEVLPDGTDLEDFLLEMQKDPDIETELKNFKSFVTQGRVNFLPASELPIAVKAAELCTEILKPKIIKEFYEIAMHCIEQGFSVIWAKFKNDKTFFSIDQFQESKFYNFDFKTDGTLTNRWTFEELKQPNWIVNTYNQRYEDKHGRSVLLPLYWVLKFEKLGYKQIVTLMDKLGVPSFAALIKPSGNDTDDQKRANTIALAIKNIRSHSGIALTAEDIKKLEAQSGSITEIDTFIRHLKEQKTRVIMGALLTSGTTGNSGTYNLSENHKAITEMRVNDVGELIAKSITNQLIPLICRLNINQAMEPSDFPVANYTLPVFSKLDDFLKVVDRFDNIQIKASTIKDIYKMPIENPDEEILTIKEKQTGIALSENAESDNLFDNFFFQKMRSKNKKQQM